MLFLHRTVVAGDPLRDVGADLLSGYNVLGYPQIPSLCRSLPRGCARQKTRPRSPSVGRIHQQSPKRRCGSGKTSPLPKCAALLPHLAAGQQHPDGQFLCTPYQSPHGHSMCQGLACVKYFRAAKKAPRWGAFLLVTRRGASPPQEPRFRRGWPPKRRCGGSLTPVAFYSSLRSLIVPGITKNPIFRWSFLW